jgi:spore maturation protein CgeB/SAM-dependent methyltransferase
VNNDRVTELYRGELFTPRTQEICRDRINWLCGQARGRKVLDIGCSQGIASILVARSGRHVVGLDIEEPAITFARAELAKEPPAVQERVRFVLGDLHDFDPGEERFDTLLMGEILEHQTDPRALFERATRFLAPDGVIAGSTPFGFHPHDDHHVTFYLSSFVRTLDGLCQLRSVEVVDGYIRFVAEHRDRTAAAPFDPAALLAQSEKAFLEVQRAAYDAHSERDRKLQKELARRAKLEGEAARAARLDAQVKSLADKLLREKTRADELGRERGKLKETIKELRTGTSVVRDRPGDPSAMDGRLSRAAGSLLSSLQRELNTGRLRTEPVTALRKTYARVRKAVRAQPPGPQASKRAPATKPAERKHSADSDEGPSFPVVEPLVRAAPTGELVIATILDTFSQHCLQYEATLVSLSRDGWKDEIERHRPAFLLVESAWQGNGGAWKHLMTKYAEKADNPLRDLLRHCAAIGLPRVFWNKEDPANFDVFKDVAADFDHVFTTDADCIPRYRALLGHDRVYALPFAAQPAIHNPMQDIVPRSRTVCFAGSWRASKYPERGQDSEVLLKPALEFGLDIFDRSHGTKNAEELAFPQPYRDAVRGSLEYDRMLAAYRGYKVFLNVNSVKDSPTMFSRRVFELMACGTPVVTSDSVGIRQMLGSLVKVADTSEQTRDHLERLLGNDDYRARYAHAGYREVLSHHTYGHRLRTILDAIGIEAPPESPTKVTILAATNRPAHLDNLLANVRRQVHRRIELVVLLNSSAYDRDAVAERVARELPGIESKVLAIDESRPLADCLNSGVDVATGQWLAKFDDDDYYGPHYLSDLLLASRYTDARVIGKCSYFAYLEGSGQLVLRDPDRIHRHGPRVCGSSLFVRRDVFDEVRFTPIQPGTDTMFLRDCVERGIRIYSADPFNYIHIRHADASSHTWKIADDEFVRRCRVVQTGLDMSQVMI